ncbi:hypothetical protein ES703_02960 [subsurface metagenome]
MKKDKKKAGRCPHPRPKGTIKVKWHKRDLAVKFTDLIKSGKLDHTKTDLSTIPDNLLHEICETEDTATQIAIIYFTVWAIHHRGNRKQGTVELTDDEMNNGCSYFYVKFGLENLRRGGLVEHYIFHGEPLDEDFTIEIKLPEGMTESEAQKIMKGFPKERIH